MIPMRLRLPLPILLPAILIAAGVALALQPPSFALRLRHAIFDAYQHWQPRGSHTSAVRVIDIDEESLARLGQWPWPRSRLAELLERAHALGARALALDISLAEPDRTAPRHLAEQWGSDTELAAALRALPDPDERLAAALERLPVATGFILTARPGGRVPRAAAGFAIAGDDPGPRLPSYAGAVATLPPLERAARGNGALNFTPDADGVVRRLPLLLRLGDALYPSLVAEALRLAEGARSHLVRCSGSRLSLRIGSRELAIDSEGQAWLHYTPSERERFLPAWRVLGEELPPGALAGAIAFVGSSAAGLRDLRFTPLGEAVAGVEIHAQLVEQVLDGSLLARPDWARSLEAVAALAVGLALVALVLRLGPLGSALAAFGAVAALGLGSWLGFARARLLLDPGIPALTAAAAFLACFVPRQLQRERERRWIRRAFSSYISRNLVNHLLANPEALRLGGERRECSFVLTDLEDFTRLVESSAPEQLVALLNEYLEGVVEIALRLEGTLDRVVGDAVAVLFSAPVEQSDHAPRALRCALEIDRFSRALREAKLRAGLAFGRTRIGVHSGIVTVGNVGGRGMLDYRALGDPINTAARLEGVNRLLGTRVCVSGETAVRCPDFLGRPVGRLLLKGRRQPIEAFEPLDPGEERTPAQQAYLAAYRLLEAGDPAALGALSALSDDPVAAFHAMRLRRGESGALVVLDEK
jgi:adenylate cyclase